MKKHRFIRSLALRLTLWYSGLLAAAAIVCFGLSYFLFASMSTRRADNYLRHETDEFTHILKQYGLKGVQDEADREARSSGINDLFVRILNRETGKQELSSTLAEWNLQSIEAHPAIFPEMGRSVIETWTDIPQHSQVRVIYAAIDSERVAQLGFTMFGERELLAEMSRLSTLFIATALIVAIPVGWLMAKQALKGVNQVTEVAEVIAAGRLDQRVPAMGGDDEVDRLARTFNLMIERIQALIEGIKQTNDNIAHELRSPLTRMRGLAEMNLAAAPAGSEHETLAENTVEECDRLLALINTMLDIAEVEAGVARLELHPVDVSDIARDACDIFDPVAENAGVTLKMELQGPVRVLGDVPKLQRVVANLLDNAIKYTPAQGVVTAEVTARDGQGFIVISDTGPGIAVEDLPHIFQRFYRGEKSRTRKGYGLGLSLAMAIVRAHKGDIVVVNTPPRGCRFAIRLPLAAGALPAVEARPATAGEVSA